MTNNSLDSLAIRKGDKSVYTIHVRSGCEKRIIKMIEKKIAGTEFQNMVEGIFIKTHKVSYHRGGKIVERESNLYPGYIYIIANLSFDLIQQINDVSGVIKLLSSTKSTPAQGKKPSEKKIANNQEKEDINPKLNEVKSRVDNQKDSNKDMLRNKVIRPGKRRKKRPVKTASGIRIIPQSLTESEINRVLGISDLDSRDDKMIKLLKGDHVRIISGPFNGFDGVIDNANNKDKKLTV